MKEIYKQQLEKRFWNKVNKSSDCWLWTGAIGTHGYGVITVCDPYKETKLVTHVAFFLTNNRWPDKGKVLMHHCDTKCCVNISHIEETSYTKNLKDAWDKGRNTCYTKLTKEKYDELVRLRNLSLSYRKIAPILGISAEALREAYVTQDKTTLKFKKG